MTINNNLKNWRNKQMNEQMQLFKNPFDDVHVGSAYINQDKTKIYIVTSMFSQYLSGLMIIRRVLNDPNKFTECCYLVKQTARMTYYDAIKEIQQGLVSIDKHEHLTVINDEY